MDMISKLAEGFMSLFQAGGEQFMGWVTGIIPMVICLMTAVNSVIKVIGEQRVESFAKKDYKVYCFTLYLATNFSSILFRKSYVLYVWTFCR